MKYRVIEALRNSNVSARRFRVAVTAAAAVASMAAIGCNDSDNNTVPLISTAITINAGSTGQVGIAGQTLSAISVHVTDQNGNSLAGAVVTWTPTTGGGSVSASTSLTDINGNATINWTLGTVAGIDSLTASIASGASAVITATVNPGVLASLTLVSGDGQQVVSGGATAALVVRAADQNGNPIANAIVNWTTSGGTLSTVSTATDATGMASVTLTTGATPATYTVTATSGSSSPVTFTITGT